MARKAAALHDASAALQAAREALCKKEQQLEEAKEAKVRNTGQTQPVGDIDGNCKGTYLHWLDPLPNAT